MSSCPCCHNTMVRQFQNHHLHWFCRTCWQEMPALEQKSLSLVSLTLAQHLAFGVRRPLTTV